MKKTETVKKEEVYQKITGEYTSKVSLNMRSGPGVNYKAINVVTPGNKVVASEKASNGWYKVKKENGTVGWVNSGYLINFKDYKAPVAKNNQSSNNKGTSGYKPNHLYFAGKAVPYKNVGMADGVGQRVIDTTNYAATWGGAATFSGTDNKSTHFIGHNPGQFTGMHTSTTFIVTDSKGRAFTYKRTARYKVNERAIEVGTGASKWNRITGVNNEEMIILQSTDRHPIKWIVEAKPVK